MPRAYLYTLIAVLTWGASLPINKAIVAAERGGTHLSATQVAAWCIAVGWVALLATLIGRRRLHLLGDFTWRAWLVLFAMGCFGWFASPVAFNIAFANLSLPAAVVINYLHPVFTVVFQGGLFGRLVRPVSGWEHARDRERRPAPLRIAVGLGLCLLGVAAIASEGRFGRIGEAASALGALAALTAAVSWGTYSNLGRFVGVKRGRQAAGLSDVQTFAAMTIGLAIMAALLAWSGETSVPRGYMTWMHFPGPEATEVGIWPLIVGMGIMVYCVGFTLWLYAMELGARSGAPEKLPPLAYLSPVLGVALGWVLLREGFGPGFWEGSALIAAGNVLNLSSRRRSER